MSERLKKRKPLSLDETVELLDAEPPEDIGPVEMDPISLIALATKCAQKRAVNRIADKEETDE